MKFQRFIFLGLFVQAMIGCAAQNSELRGGVANAWSFKLTNGDFQLTDSDQQSGAHLRAQVAKIYSLVHRFQDPVVWSRRPKSFSEPWSSHFTIYSSKTPQAEFDWVQSYQNHFSNDFGNCTVSWPSLSKVPCEAVALLNCLEHHAERLQASDGNSDSSPFRSVLLNGLKECGMSTQLVSRTSPEYRFSIQNREARFSPFPVFSLLLYQGVWSSYEDANAQSSAVATFADSSCARTDAACLSSPLSLGSCQGCEGLEKGQLYTVFFIENLRQNYDVVKSVPYVH